MESIFLLNVPSDAFSMQLIRACLLRRRQNEGGVPVLDSTPALWLERRKDNSLSLENWFSGAGVVVVVDQGMEWLKFMGGVGLWEDVAKRCGTGLGWIRQDLGRIVN
jgi:hypothetical protein